MFAAPMMSSLARARYTHALGPICNYVRVNASKSTPARRGDHRAARVDVHIFLFPFALDTCAGGAACQSEGTEAKRVVMEEKSEGQRDGRGSGNEIEVGSEGERSGRWREKGGETGWM